MRITKSSGLKILGYGSVGYVIHGTNIYFLIEELI